MFDIARIKYIGAHIKELGELVRINDNIGTFKHGKVEIDRVGFYVATITINAGTFVIDTLVDNTYMNFDNDYADLETIYNMLGDDIIAIDRGISSIRARGAIYNIDLGRFDLERTINNHRIHQLMEKYYFSVDEMAKLLYSTNCVIAGGAALTILAPHAIESDLDIFLHCPKFHKFTILALEKLHAALCAKNYNVIAFVNRSYESSHIQVVKTYELNGRKIQIITIQNRTISEMFEKFDIDVCRVALVPKAAGTFNINASQEVLDNIKKRQMKVILQASNTHDRIQKYITKGFKWTK